MNLSSMLDKRSLQMALKQNPDIVVSVPDLAEFFGTVDVVWVAEVNKLVILCESKKPGGTWHDLRQLFDDDQATGH